MPPLQCPRPRGRGLPGRPFTGSGGPSWRNTAVWEGRCWVTPTDAPALGSSSPWEGSGVGCRDFLVHSVFTENTVARDLGMEVSETSARKTRTSRCRRQTRAGLAAHGAMRKCESRAGRPSRGRPHPGRGNVRGLAKG